MKLISGFYPVKDLHYMKRIIAVLFIYIIYDMGTKEGITRRLNNNTNIIKMDVNIYYMGKMKHMRLARDDTHRFYKTRLEKLNLLAVVFDIDLAPSNELLVWG